MTTFDAHANFAFGVVTGAPGSAGTQLEVTPGQETSFATPPFNMVAFPPLVQPSASNAEVVRVTAINGIIFTIVRAQESTSAQNITTGWQLAAGITAKTVADLEDVVTSLQEATVSTGVGVPPSPTWMLEQWTLSSAFTLVSASRDSNGAITTASITWPDGATGTFTTDTASTAFPGAVDAYHVTYVYGTGPTTKTITQAAVTRDANSGAVTAQPALTVA